MNQNIKSTCLPMKRFELSNPREHFYDIRNIHLVLPSTPTLMVTLVLQLWQLDGD